jgi:hypothetical protein
MDDHHISIFEILHQKILQIYEDSHVTHKWTQVATLINKENKLIHQIFVFLYKSNLKEIILDYDIPRRQLTQRIIDESDKIMKLSYLITSFHHIIYDLLSQEGNYYFSLQGKEEMSALNKNITYYIHISSENEKNIFFYSLLFVYALESLFFRYFYLCMDFEYTDKKIQLAQLNFEHQIANKSFIMIINPDELEPYMTNAFINMLLCNKKIKKILHGADSLDIPYLYDHLMQSNAKKIIKFTRSIIDTRFLCEYYRLNRSEPDNKCSIYDEDPQRSAVYNFGLISTSQQEKLTKMLISLPHHHDIKWNIHRMPESQILYAQYDTIFLKYFYYRIIVVATRDASNQLGKKAIIEIYKYVLVELIQFVYLEKKEITSLTIKCKEESDPINNYMIRQPGNVLKLIDIYKEINNNIMTTRPPVNIDHLLKVNQFKFFITTIIKKMIYTILSHRCKIYKDRNTIWNTILSNDEVINFFKEKKFFYLYRLFQDIEIALKTKLANYCSKGRLL